MARAPDFQQDAFCLSGPGRRKTPASMKNAPTQVRRLGTTNFEHHGIYLGIQNSCGERLSKKQINLVGPGNSLDISVTFPSVRFPSRFRQRFRYVSANVSMTFPLRGCVPDGSYPETPPTFPGPTKGIQICGIGAFRFQCPSVV